MEVASEEMKLRRPDYGSLSTHTPKQHDPKPFWTELHEDLEEKDIVNLTNEWIFNVKENKGNDLSEEELVFSEEEILLEDNNMDDNNIRVGVGDTLFFPRVLPPTIVLTNQEAGICFGVQSGLLLTMPFGKSGNSLTAPSPRAL